MKNLTLKLSKLFIILLIGLVFVSQSCKQEKKEQVKEKILVSYSIEKFNDTAIISDNDETIIFKKRNLVTVDEAHSGTYSIKLDSLREYAFGNPLKLSSDKIYKVSFWKNTTAEKVYAVAGFTNNYKIFYKQSAEIKEEGQNGWKKVELEFSIPENLNDESFTIYVWNAAKADVYIDDFQITEIPID